MRHRHVGGRSTVRLFDDLNFWSLSQFPSEPHWSALSKADLVSTTPYVAEHTHLVDCRSLRFLLTLFGASLLVSAVCDSSVDGRQITLPAIWIIFLRAEYKHNRFLRIPASHLASCSASSGDARGRPGLTPLMQGRSCCLCCRRLSFLWKANLDYNVTKSHCQPRGCREAQNGHEFHDLLKSSSAQADISTRTSGRLNSNLVFLETLQIPPVRDSTSPARLRGFICDALTRPEANTLVHEKQLSMFYRRVGTI